jgi:lambda family phage portal protein
MQIEKLISWLSPNWALRRAEARDELRFLSSAGRYQAASAANSAFENFITAVTSADSSVDYGDREKLIAQSHAYIRDIPIASGILKRICDHAVGEHGLLCRPKIDQEFLNLSKQEARDWQRKTAKEWRYFSESKDCDYNRINNFGEQVYNTLFSELEGGDCFTLLLNEKNNFSDYNLKFQLLEGEQVSNPNFSSNSSELMYGVGKDRKGVPIQYYFQETHPGENTNRKYVWEARKIYNSLGRRVILHHFQQARPGQTRGIPLLATVSEKMLNLGTLSRAELLASVLNSYYTLIFKGDKKDLARKKTAPTSSTTQQPQNKQKLGSGTILEVPRNVEIQSFDPQRPNQNYKSFFDANLGEIGAATGVPKSMILMWYDRSYSASTGEVLLAWRFFSAMRVHMAVNKCQPCYEAFLDEAVSKGRIVAPGYFSDPRIRRAYTGSAYDQWVGPKMPAMDVLKEAKAEAVRINELQIKSREQSVAELGLDWMESVFPALEEENNKLKAAKIKVDTNIDDNIDTRELGNEDS